MALSINPLDLIRFLKDSKEREGQRAIAWLESVRAEANALANVWNDINVELQKSESVKMVERFIGMQSLAASRLDEFYRYLTPAVGTKLSPYVRDRLIFKLAVVLLARQVTRTEAEKIIKSLKEERITLLDTDNDFSKMNNISDLVDLLQKEVAALDVLIQTVKASPELK